MPALRHTVRSVQLASRINSQARVSRRKKQHRDHSDYSLPLSPLEFHIQLTSCRFPVYAPGFTTFHSPFGVVFIIRSHYSFAIGLGEYLALRSYHTRIHNGSIRYYSRIRKIPRILCLRACHSLRGSIQTTLASNPLFSLIE